MLATIMQWFWWAIAGIFVFVVLYGAWSTIMLMFYDPNSREARAQLAEHQKLVKETEAFLAKSKQNN